MSVIRTCITDQACNNHCLFCTRPNDPSLRSVWGFVCFKSKEQLFCEFSAIRKETDAIVLSGGEPAIRKDFLELLEKLVELDFRVVQIQSNARVFSNAEFAQEVVSVLGCRAEFFVSLHSYKRELINELNGVKSASECFTGLKNLLELNVKLRIDTVVTKMNYEDLAFVVDFLAGMNIRELELIFVHPNGRAWENRQKIIPRIEETVPFVKEAVVRGRGQGVKLAITRYPFCVLGDFVRDSVEFYLGADSDNHLGARVKGKECGQCIYFVKCPGVWKSYLEIFDFEFKPVKSSTG